MREILELSMAIKCPSIDFHLLTLKKFQQVLSQDETLYSIMNDQPKDGVDKLRDIFRGIWSLEDLEDQNVKDVIAKAIKEPSKYVIKPQKEGGGNNFYGESIR